MKPLYNIADNQKQTYFNLCVLEILDKIDERTDEWFNDVFIKPKIVDEACLTANLKQDIDYLLSQAIWLINLGKSLGYVIDAERFVQSKYDTYTASPTGYRMLVHDERYNRHKHKLYTEAQVEKNREKSNKIMRKILGEILADKK